MDKVGIMYMIEEKIRYYSIDDSSYPEKLRQLPKPPQKLYVMGNLPDPDKPAVAIVGAREASPYGRYVALEFARVLAINGIQVISGFARGIDRAGHEGALQAQTPTFGILGCGVDVCYPRENIDLYSELIRTGGLISEYEPGTQPRAGYFPLRNRLISAFADKVLVVEARIRSGALITADHALEQGKDVYAVPGRIDDELSAGCNRLIAQGAAIALSPEELLKDFETDRQNFITFHKKSKLTLAPEEETVYSCIRLQPKHVEELMAETGIELPKLLSILLELELKKMIKEITKNQYIRV